MKLATILIIMGLAMSCMCFMDRELAALKKIKSKLSTKKGITGSHVTHVNGAITSLKNKILTALPAVRTVLKIQRTRLNKIHHYFKKSLKQLTKFRRAGKHSMVIRIIKKIRVFKHNLSDCKKKLTSFKAQKHLIVKARAVVHRAKKLIKKVHKVYRTHAAKTLMKGCCDPKHPVLKTHKKVKKVTKHVKLAVKAKKVHHKLKKLAQAIKIVKKVAHVTIAVHVKKVKAKKVMKKACKTAKKASKSASKQLAGNMCAKAKATVKKVVVQSKKLAHNTALCVKNVAKQVKVKVHVSPKHCHCHAKKIVIKHGKVTVVKKRIVQKRWRAFKHCDVHWQLLTVGSATWKKGGWVHGMKRMQIPKKVPANQHKLYKSLVKKDVKLGMLKLDAKVPKAKLVVMKKIVKKVEAKKHMVSADKQFKHAKAMKKVAKAEKKITKSLGGMKKRISKLVVARVKAFKRNVAKGVKTVGQVKKTLSGVKTAIKKSVKKGEAKFIKTVKKNVHKAKNIGKTLMRVKKLVAKKVKASVQKFKSFVAAKLKHAKAVKKVAKTQKKITKKLGKKTVGQVKKSLTGVKSAITKSVKKGEANFVKIVKKNIHKAKKVKAVMMKVKKSVANKVNANVQKFKSFVAAKLKHAKKVTVKSHKKLVHNIKAKAHHIVKLGHKLKVKVHKKLTGVKAHVKAFLAHKINLKTLGNHLKVKAHKKGTGLKMKVHKSLKNLKHKFHLNLKIHAKKPLLKPKAHKVVAHKVGGMTKGSLGPKNWANHKKSMKSNKKPVVKAHLKLGKSLVAHKKPVVEASVPKMAF